MEAADWPICRIGQRDATERAKSRRDTGRIPIGQVFMALAMLGTVIGIEIGSGSIFTIT